LLDCAPNWIDAGSSISTDSGVAEVAGNRGKSSSASIATVMRRSSFEHELRMVFFRILAIYGFAAGATT
jgi:hypothetical protein